MRLFPQPPWSQFTELIPSEFTIDDWQENWLYYPEEAGGGAKFLGWFFRITKKRPDLGKILVDTVQVSQLDLDNNANPCALEALIKARVEIAILSLRDLESQAT